MAKEYNDDAIKVLSDIEHIRKRSSMYISTDRPSYQMWSELADNAVDEAMNGYASQIIFHIDYEKSYISVEDNGRGLPQGFNKELNKPTIYAIYQKLNAGGKYDQDSYTVSGGLNGVGSTVVNALSKEFHVKTWRNGSVVEARFHFGESEDYQSYTDNTYKKKSGTFVEYMIDKEHPLFVDDLKDYEKDIVDKISLLKTLLPSVDIQYNGESVKERRFDTFLYLSNSSLLEESVVIQNKTFNLALNWSTENNKYTSRTYCNAIFTPQGGDHEKGLCDALWEIFGNDYALGLNLALSVMFSGAEYDSQAKLKAVSKDMRGFVKEKSLSELKYYFKQNPDIKTAVVELLKKKRYEINKRNNKSSVRRDKKTAFLNALGSSAFADCTTKNREEAELIIVEGNSAAGSARQARDVRTQAVAPLRGKFINSFTSDVAALLKNQEVGMLISSINCGIFQDVNIKNSRYGKIIIMADADPDGENIACLLLSFFLNVAPELVDNGYIYLALPPLYGTHVKGKFTPISTIEERDDYLAKGYEITRFKGLGEMNPEQLKISCLDSNTRHIIQITSSTGCFDMVKKIMGGDSSERKRLLVESKILIE